MKCLLKYQWLKLPREHIPADKGIMGFGMILASRAAFRTGRSRYCGHTNDVSAGSWVGGIVGLKSILGVRSRQKALDILQALSEYGYIDYTLDAETKILSYTVRDWLSAYSGQPTESGTVYTTAGYGFLCVPRAITQRLVDAHYKFDDADAWLDLWCHTVWQEKRNAFSKLAPTIQFGYESAILTLDMLAKRWGWEKTKVWRFIHKHPEFTLMKLPGSFGCVVFNTLYPINGAIHIDQSSIAHMVAQLCAAGSKVQLALSDNQRLNRLVLWYSNSITFEQVEEYAFTNGRQPRVALSALYNTCAYISPESLTMYQFKNCERDCSTAYRRSFISAHIGDTSPPGLVSAVFIQQHL